MFVATLSEIRHGVSRVCDYIHCHTSQGVTCSWLHSVTYAAGCHLFVVTFIDMRRRVSRVRGYIH